MILKFEFGETKHLHEVQNTAAICSAEYALNNWAPAAPTIRY